MEVGRQHHAHQHLSTQIITALSFSVCVEDVMRFPHVSFHICVVKSASTHDVSCSVPRTLSTFTLMKNLLKWHAGPSEGFKQLPGPFCAVASMLAFVDCRWQGNWISIYKTVAWVWLSVILFKLHANTFLCTVSFEFLCVVLILPPSHRACMRVHKDNKLGQSAFPGRARKSTNTPIIHCYR